MSRIQQTMLQGLLFAGLIGSVQAAEVQLVATTPIEDLEMGEVVEFEILIDFGDIPGGTLGGGFDISYDSSVLAFMSLNTAGLGDPDMGREPDSLTNLLESWAVGDFDGVAGAGPTLVGTVEFEVISTAGPGTQVSVGPTSSIGGPWISGEDNVSELIPSYNQVSITLNLGSLFKEGFESN